jgi:D-3-phosphoglycerate dehydrogenase
LKILFLDSVHPILEEKLTEKGFVCLHEYKKSKTEVEDIICEFDGIVIRSRFKVDKRFIEKSTKLKFIARSGAGMENIDVTFALQKGIKCYNSPEGNRDAVAEHAIGMLLTLCNNLCRANYEAKQGIWNREKNRGIEIAGKTVGIIGYGFMGAALAERLKGFRCNIIAYDKYKLGFGNEFVKECTLQEIFENTDILSIHLPQSLETEYYVNSNFINQFSKPIYLINTARGKNVNTEHLVNALKEEKIKGACLDVLEYEEVSFENLDKNLLPKTFQYLAESEKVIISPHIAGWTSESYIKLSSFLADKILSDFA